MFIDICFISVWVGRGKEWGSYEEKVKIIQMKILWGKKNFHGKGGEVVKLKVMCLFISMKGGSEVVKANNNCIK
jgi:hypothetical protein